MRHPELPVGALTAALLVLVPVPHQVRVKNWGTVSLIVWLCVTNLIYGMDEIIWAENVNITAVVWCDISASLSSAAESISIIRSYQDHHRGQCSYPSLLFIYCHSLRATLLVSRCNYDQGYKTATPALRPRALLGLSHINHGSV
jgi:hypothetical protein